MNGASFFIVLAWAGRVPAGPVVGGPPWLFPVREHADAYARQLAGIGVDAAVIPFAPRVTEYDGRPLVVHPPFPAPSLAAGALPPPPDEPVLHDNATSSDLPPPPPPPPPEDADHAEHEPAPNGAFHDDAAMPAPPQE